MARLYTLLEKIINKMMSLNTDMENLTSRFYNRYTINLTNTNASGFTSNAQAEQIFGSVLYCYAYSTKSSNFDTGNITNTTFVTHSPTNYFYTFYEKSSMSGGTGGLKSLMLKHGDTSAADYYYAHVFAVNAVDTADKSAQYQNWIHIDYPQYYI